MGVYLGIDTSNYTTSVAIYDHQTGELLQKKRLLPVKNGALGLKQSDAVFSHVKQLGQLVQELAGDRFPAICGVGVSTRPRDVEGSYMPCFLVGEMVARSVAAVCNVPLYPFSHQCGHIAAALYSTHRLDLMAQPFLAFHFSGGTTECLHVTPSPVSGFAVELLSRSLDLKAGQAIDRVGGMLGLPFPAGPQLDELSRKSTREFRVKPTFKEKDGCFSGVENQCAKMLQQGEKPEDIARYCIEYVAAAAKKMWDMAREIYPGEETIFAGGVMSNSLIREKLQGEHAFFAKAELSSDNAAGIAVLAALKGE